MKTLAEIIFNRNTSGLFEKAPARRSPPRRAKAALARQSWLAKAATRRTLMQGVVGTHRFSCVSANRAEHVAMFGAKIDAEDGGRKSVRRYERQQQENSGVPQKDAGRRYTIKNKCARGTAALQMQSEQNSKGEEKANRNTRELTQHLSTCNFNDLIFSIRNKNAMLKSDFHFASHFCEHSAAARRYVGKVQFKGKRRIHSNGRSPTAIRINREWVRDDTHWEADLGGMTTVQGLRDARSA